MATTQKISALMLGYRAHFVRVEPDKQHYQLKVHGWPETVLIFDTETTTDPTQRLNFGSFVYGRWSEGKIVVLRRGLFYADDLPKRDAEGFSALLNCQLNDLRDDSVDLELMRREDFVHAILWKSYLAGALICGFNLAFDLSRIAIDCGEGRGFFYGGFSIPIWGYDAGGGILRWHPYRPRFNVKPIDSKRAFFRFSGTKQPQNGVHPDDVHGHLLDLRTLAFALTGESHSLRSAGKAFGAETRKQIVEQHGVITRDYIEYNLQDVRATLSLLEREREEFDEHPIELDPTRALSPAAVGKAYLRGMNITPPSIKFGDIPDEYLGYAMTAYYGGRAEGRIRHQIVPVVMLDVLSMYPTVNTLLGNWELLTAEGLDVTDATAELQALLDSVTPADVFRPAFWRSLPMFGEIDANGDVLPVRARYGDNDAFSIGVNEVHGSTAWYAAPDLVASKLLSGRAPRVRRAFKLVRQGLQADMRPVALAGHTPVDPERDDFFKVVIEARQRTASDLTLPAFERDRLRRFLKVVANSSSYGVFAEINPKTLPADETVSMRLHGLQTSFEVNTRWPEDGGEFCFPPLASLITAGARLMLALLQRCVTDEGGVYAACDTDSMAIVATPTGGVVVPQGTSKRRRATVPALSFAQVDAIVARFEQLNPYDRSVVRGSILKVEDENFTKGDKTTRQQAYALVISAKRYALFNLDGSGQVDVRKASEHGLGHLLDPVQKPEALPDESASIGPKAPRWICDVWRVLIDRARGKRVRRPSWLDLPAVSRVTITTPQLLDRFGGMRRDRWYDERLKPFNFLIAAHFEYFGQSEDPTTGTLFDAATCRLMAPYTNRPGEWLSAEWIDRATGQRVLISTAANLSEPGVARVQSYGDVVDRYWAHVEAKSTAPDGSPCEPGTVGILARRVVQCDRHVYLSKEARKIEEVENGQVGRWSDVLDVFIDEESDWRVRLLPRLRAMKRADAAKVLGISERAVTELRQGRSRPSPETRRRIREMVEMVEMVERVEKVERVERARKGGI